MEALLLHSRTRIAPVGHVGCLGSKLLCVHRGLLVYDHGRILGEMVQLQRLALQQAETGGGKKKKVKSKMEKKKCISVIMQVVNVVSHLFNQSRDP